MTRMFCCWAFCANEGSGAESSEVEEQLGLNVNSSEVSGALQSSRISSERIEAGGYDNARISTYLVNWVDPAQYVLDRVSLVGEIVREDGTYRMELRSLASELDQSSGNHFISRCQASLGDARCKVNLENATFTSGGLIVEVRSPLILQVSGLDSFESDWFRGGTLTWRDGDNSGRTMPVAEHIVSGEETVLHLWQDMPKRVRQGDGFTITAGCDKQFATCKAKFSNHLNFRGFPHMPGNQFVLGYAGQKDTFDGGPIVP